MKEIIKNYEAPTVEVLEIEVEKGFATSNDETGTGIPPLGGGNEW